MGVTDTQESGTRSLHKFLELCHAFLHKVFFLCQKLVPAAGIRNLHELVSNYLCKFLVPVSDARFLSVCHSYNAIAIIQCWIQLFSKTL